MFAPIRERGKRAVRVGTTRRAVAFAPMAVRTQTFIPARTTLAAAGATVGVVLLDVGAVWRGTQRCAGGAPAPGPRLARFCNGDGVLFHAWPVALAIAVVAVLLGASLAVRSRSLTPLAVAAAPAVAALVLAWWPAFLPGA